MFHTISWAGYSECIFYSLSFYYAAILTVYYRKDILLKFNQYQQQLDGTVPAHTSAGDADNKKDDDQKDTSLFPAVHDLLEVLKKVFQSAREKKSPKEELLLAIALQLRDYPLLIGTAFQFAVNNHIMQQVQLQCGYTLEETDMKPIWNHQNLTGVNEVQEKQVQQE